MPAKNDVTKDELVSKAATQAYRDNWDRIFGGKHAKQSGIQEGLQTGVQETGILDKGEEAKGEE